MPNSGAQPGVTPQLGHGRWRLPHTKGPVRKLAAYSAAIPSVHNLTPFFGDVRIWFEVAATGRAAARGPHRGVLHVDVTPDFGLGARVATFLCCKNTRNLLFSLQLATCRSSSVGLGTCTTWNFYRPVLPGTFTVFVVVVTIMPSCPQNVTEIIPPPNNSY